MKNAPTTGPQPAKEVAADPAKRWAWIQWQLKSNGRTFAAIAESEGVNKDTLSKAKNARYPRMERALSEAVGVAVHVLFPDRYDEHGMPTLLYRGRKHIPHKIAKAAQTRNVQKRKAA
jgi:lambda repressor-like predicted transcriptional regulator